MVNSVRITCTNKWHLLIISDSYSPLKWVILIRNLFSKTFLSKIQHCWKHTYTSSRQEFSTCEFSCRYSFSLNFFYHSYAMNKLNFDEWWSHPIRIWLAHYSQTSLVLKWIFIWCNDTVYSVYLLIQTVLSITNSHLIIFGKEY